MVLLGDRPPGTAAPRRIENVKFNEAVGDLSADGLVVMTWAFQAADIAEQAQNPGSNPGRRISFYSRYIFSSYDELLFVNFIF